MLETGRCTFSDSETVYLLHDIINQKQNSRNKLETPLPVDSLYLVWLSLIVLKQKIFKR